MDDVELMVEVTVTRDADGRNFVTDRHHRVFKLPLRRHVKVCSRGDMQPEHTGFTRGLRRHGL